MGLMSFLKGLFSSESAEAEDVSMPALPPARRAAVSVPLVAATPVVAPPPPPPSESVHSDGRLSVNFLAVFESAGIVAEQRSRVTKAEDLLKSLPKEASSELKRQIVEAAFQAFDVPLDSIVQAAVSERDAIRAYVDLGRSRTDDAVAAGAVKVADLEAQIVAARAEVARQEEHQRQREASAQDRGDAIRQVLKFFERDGGQLGLGGDVLTDGDLA